jgi:hypothetical protein
MTRRNRRIVVTRWLVAVLTAVAATCAAVSEVVSLNRFARDYLYFPPGLAWTLPAVVTVATIAGALMWTVLRETELRDAGRRLNVSFSVVSSFAVGLDHMSGARGWWMVPAFAAGALIPSSATWLTHLLARLTDTPKETAVDLLGEPDVPSQVAAVPVETEPIAEPETEWVPAAPRAAVLRLTPPEPRTEPEPDPVTANPPAEQPASKMEIAKAHLREKGLEARWSQQLGAEIKVSKPTFSKAKAELRRELAEAVSA